MQTQAEKPMEKHNAECAWCEAGLMVTNDGRHPSERVAGIPTRLVFCNSLCHSAWQTDHCDYCGQTPRTTTLTVVYPDKKFCDPNHARAAGRTGPQLVT